MDEEYAQGVFTVQCRIQINHLVDAPTTDSEISMVSYGSGMMPHAYHTSTRRSRRTRTGLEIYEAALQT